MKWTLHQYAKRGNKWTPLLFEGNDAIFFSSNTLNHDFYLPVINGVYIVHSFIFTFLEQSFI